MLFIILFFLSIELYYLFIITYNNTDIRIYNNWENLCLTIITIHHILTYEYLCKMQKNQNYTYNYKYK